MNTDVHEIALSEFDQRHPSSESFFRNAKLFSSHPALTVPVFTSTRGWIEHTSTFEELANTILQLEKALRDEGFRNGDQVLVHLPVSADFFALSYALRMLGAVPLCVGHTIRSTSFRKLIAWRSAKAIIASERFHKMTKMLPMLSNCLRYTLGESDSSFFDLKDRSVRQATTFHTSTTSMNPAQASLLVDMPWSHMLAIQNLNRGVRTVLPAVDNYSGTEFDPQVVANQIMRHEVNRISAPLFVHQALCTYLVNRGMSLPMVRWLIVGESSEAQHISSLALKAFPRAEAL